MSREEYYQKMIRIPPEFLPKLQEAEELIKEDPAFFEIGVPGRKGSFSKFVRWSIDNYLEMCKEEKEAAKNAQSNKNTHS